MRSAAAKAGRATATVVLLLLVGTTACGRPGGPGPGDVPSGATPAGTASAEPSPAADAASQGDRGGSASYSQGGDPVGQVPEPPVDTGDPETTGVGSTPSDDFPTLVPSCTGPSGEMTACPTSASTTPTPESSPSPSPDEPEGAGQSGPSQRSGRSDAAPGLTPAASGTR
ncbi:hypothetical protein ACH4FX_34750 [Streptomyces sp. NPDC018019]|uniref:hypothetical protein n=1 Tax=Streptomyces sp. NPDC018019 TaxID=3365030 RepID=UPI0037A4AF89